MITCTQKPLSLWLAHWQWHSVKLSTPSPFLSAFYFMIISISAPSPSSSPSLSASRKRWMMTIWKREDLLAATTPPLPVYHLTDRNHCHHICQDESLDNDDNEPGKGGRQSELILKRNSLNSQYVLRSNLMMSAKKGSFEMIAKHKSWKLLLHVIVYSHLRCSTSRDNFLQFYL